MILRDPVHGLIVFNGWAERIVHALLETEEVQRLRRVRQLGLASMVFPGAEHSRFAHALGAAHVMVRLQERIHECESLLPPEARLDEETAIDALAAALLHDLGHGPFSHLFEEVLPHAKHHETWTQEIILDPDTGVHRALERHSAGMADRVSRLLAGECPLSYMSKAVSGTLDVDRSDYLLRDSHMTGVRYGLFDLDWVLRALTFAEVQGQWALAIEGRKGLPPVESFFLGRHFMYQQVYHHKATRAAEALVRAIFVRVRQLIEDGSSPESLPRAFRTAALGQPMSTQDYIRLDDADFMSCVAAWEHGSDAKLAELCASLRHRRLPKTIPLKLDDPQSWQLAAARAKEIVTAHGGRADLDVWLDMAEDTPYEEPKDSAHEGLWVQIRHQPLQRLGDASFLLGELRNKTIRRPRLIYPAALRLEIEAALQGVAGHV